MINISNCFVVFLTIIRSISNADDVIDLTLLEKEMPVILANVVFRHGERTPPDWSYPTDPLRNNISQIWPQGALILTNTGKRSLFELGKWLRGRYHGLLGDFYSSESVFVLSTKTDRTVMSAQSLLAGLFPPVGKQVWNQDLLWQPIPVVAYDKTAGGLLNKDDAVNCPKFWKEFESLQLSKEYHKLVEKYENLSQYLTENTGRDTDIYLDIDILDYFEIQEMENLTLPKWAENIYPEPWHTAVSERFVLHTFTDTLKRLFMGPLIKEVLNQFKMKKSSLSERKLNLYSGHEINLSNLLNTLGVYNWKLPPFSSAVLMELRIDQLNQYYVTIFFKNSSEDAHLLTIPGCQSVCPLDEFLTLFTPYKPTNWSEECSLGFTNSALHLGSTAVYILVTLLICLC